MTRTPHSPIPSQPHPTQGGRPRRRPSRTAAALALLVAAAGGLSGCSAMSEATAVKPYQAADGYNTTVPFAGGELKLQNMLVVTSGAYKPGQVVGGLIYEGKEALTLSLAEVARSSFEVKPGVLTKLGPGGTSLVITLTPAPPGGHTQLTFVNPEGARFMVEVPVLSNTGYYSSISPTAPTGEPTPTGQATPDAEASPGTEASPSEGAQSTASPTATP
ncbi:MAG: hypothetical protein U0Q15_08560 [Kineosporiaceae bacterium]